MSSEEREEISVDITVEVFADGAIEDTFKLEDLYGLYMVSFEKPHPEGNPVNGFFIGNVSLEEAARTVVKTFWDAEDAGAGKRCLLEAVVEMCQEDIEVKKLALGVTRSLRERFDELMERYEGE